MAILLRSTWGWGDGSIDKLLALQVRRPKFDSQNFYEKVECVVTHVCNHGKVETGIIEQCKTMFQKKIKYGCHLHNDN